MITLAEIVGALCRRSGFTEDQYDVSQLDSIEIPGYVLTRETDALGAIAPLRMVGAFDIVDRGEQLRFPRRGGEPVATIMLEDLGPTAEGEERKPPIAETSPQDIELPRQVRLLYTSLARDYEQGEQLSPARIGAIGVSDVPIMCPVMLTDEMAAQVAEVVFREMWASRDGYEFTLGPEYHSLESADVLLVPYEGRLIRVRIKQFDDRGLQLRQVVAVRDDDGSYVSTAVATPPKKPGSTVTMIAGSEALFLDLPALLEEHDDGGFYVAARQVGSGHWPGARLYKSVDGTAFNVATQFAARATIGTVVSAPSSGDTSTWDDVEEYVIELERGTLESRTDGAVLAGANACAVGAHGRWHIFQFGDAELTTSGEYVLSHLLLGRRGTEHLLPTVQPGDTFVLLSGPGIYRVPLQTPEIGEERTYRTVTAGAPISSADDQPFTGEGQALVPFSPINVNVDTDTAGDVTITWERRDRLKFDDGPYVPLSEAAEAYEVDILDDDTAQTVLRTISSSTPEIVYTVAQQTADFGAPNDTFAFRIYQISAIVGRGTPYESP